MTTSWRLNGKVLVACNCDWGCPCNFNARPTTGKCEGGWTWHVEEGSYDDVKLDGLSFSVYVNWPGAIHEGNGEALVLIDERADPGQRSAIEALIGGKIGGPWQVLSWTWPKVHGPYAVRTIWPSTASRPASGAASTSRSKAARSGILSRAPKHIPASSSRRASFSSKAISARRLDSGSPTASSTDHSGQYMALGPFGTPGREHRPTPGC